MTDGYVKADPAAWATALTELQAARTAFNTLTEQHAAIKAKADEAGDRLVQAEEALLDLHAPDLPAVIEKLEIIFEPAMWNECLESERKVTVIGDLRRILREA
jgi:hypothetical protein